MTDQERQKLQQKFNKDFVSENPRDQHLNAMYKKSSSLDRDNIIEDDSTGIISKEKINFTKFLFKEIALLFSVRGPENLKKSKPKKLVKSNKSISRKKIFLTKFFFFFLQFQKLP